MDNGNESNDISRQRSDGNEGWGATASLRRNFRMDKKADDEITPLLGDGSASGSGSGNNSEDSQRQEVEWEGYADYEGLTLWKKPTVHRALSSCCDIN
jgi:hypothetical protein